MLHTEFHSELSEKVTENILGALFTQVLGWPMRDLHWQLGRADLVVASHQQKHLVIETKKPGKFARVPEVVQALRQVYRYAAEQNLEQAAVTDGFLFLQMARRRNGWVPRVVFRLDSPESPAVAIGLLSPDGIHKKSSRGLDESLLARLGFRSVENEDWRELSGAVHEKLALPAYCFAFVGEYGNPGTWKFPYRHPDGSPDEVRLPRAIRAVLALLREPRDDTLPREALPTVVGKLSRAAWEAGKCPSPGIRTAPSYHALAAMAGRLGVHPFGIAAPAVC